MKRLVILIGGKNFLRLSQNSWDSFVCIRLSHAYRSISEGIFEFIKLPKIKFKVRQILVLLIMLMAIILHTYQYIILSKSFKYRFDFPTFWGKFWLCEYNSSKQLYFAIPNRLGHCVLNCIFFSFYFRLAKCVVRQCISGKYWSKTFLRKIIELY